MRDSDSLHSLIQSLSEQEKRQFRNFTRISQKKPTQLLDLFEALNQLGMYDKSLLEKRFKNLNVLKFKLKQLVMKSLRVFRDGASYEKLINNHLEDCKILHEKGLYSESDRSLEKARELAIKFEKAADLIEISKIELHRSLNRKKDIADHVREKISMQQTWFKKLAGELEMANHYYEIFASHRTDLKAFAEKLQDARARPELVLEDEQDTFMSKVYFHLALTTLARTKGELNEARVELENLRALWEEYDHQKAEYPHRYKTILANLAMICTAQGDRDKVHQLLEKLQKIPDQNFHDEAETFQSTALLRILYCLDEAKFQEGKALINEVERGLEKFSDQMVHARKFAIWYNLILLCFVIEDFKKTEFWIEEIISHKSFEVRREVQSITRILQLITYLEIGKYEILEDRIEAAHRYLYRKGKMDGFRKLVIRNLRKLLQVPDFKREDVFLEFHAELKALMDEESPRNILGGRLVQGWVESKIKGTSLQEILITWHIQNGNQGPQPTPA